ncbi:MAG: hypothetical protein RQ743_07515 [Bacteroidales bacterium]|nr:hypothetical protein [Bacteroidales bacterium]
MDKNFTRFLRYYQIDTTAVDLFSDAFGYEYCLQKILPAYKSICEKPGDNIVNKLLHSIDRVSDKY